MKNRKRIIVAFMLVAVMLLGIGYAAFTDTLALTGNAHIDPDDANLAFDNNIYFSAAEATSSTGTGTNEDTVAFDTDNASFVVNKLAEKDQVSVFTFTIKNDSDLDATVSINPTKLSGAANPSNSNDTMFDVQYTYPDGMTIAANGGTIDVVVTVTVSDIVTGATSATFGIEYTVTSVDPAP